MGEMSEFYVSVYVPTRSYRVLAASEQDARNFAVYKFNDDLEPVITSSSGPLPATGEHELEAPKDFSDGEDW